MTFEAQLADITDQTLATLKHHVETELRALVSRLVATAAEEQQEAVARGREQIGVELRRLATAELEAASRQARERLDMVRREFELQLAEARSHADAQIAVAREEERRLADAHAAPRVLDAIRSLDACQQLTGVLEALLATVTAEVPRAALLVVSGDRLRGFGFRGFALGDGRQVEMAIVEAGLAGAAVDARASVTGTFPASGTAPQSPPFACGDGQRTAMAAPVLVAGEVVAVLYADAPSDGSSSAANRWTAIVEVIVRHAGRCLEALMAIRALGAAPTGAGVPNPLNPWTGWIP